MMEDMKVTTKRQEIGYYSGVVVRATTDLSLWYFISNPNVG